ncbi:hypothetical protein [Fontivita pretiosa]|uniref:hypothetical protein n=1 Tax=Fontivita pretiosa TaxID=2989684 RepID=UPI003D185D6E
MAHPGEKKILFNFPLKGRDRGLANANQRPGTTRDALNVLPWDATQNRARGGQRSGLSKLFTGQLVGRVTGIHQIVGIDPGGTGSTGVFTETFSYSDGNLETVSGAAWLIYSDTQGSSAVGSGINVSSSDAFWTQPGSGTQLRSAFRALSNPPIPAVYEASATVTFTGSRNASSAAWFGFSFDTGTGTTDGFRVNFGTHFGLFDGEFAASITITDWNEGTTNVNLGTQLTFGVQYTLKVRIEEDGTVRAYIDGVEKASRTNCIEPGASGYARLGIYGRTNNSSSVRCNDVSFVESTIVEPSRVSKLLVTTRNVYLGTTSGVSLIGSNQLSGQKPAITDLFGKAYIVDGTNTKVVDVNAATIANLTADPGKGSVPTGCRIAVTWRGRLVLAAPDSNPQNIFMSRAGTPTDWLYGQTDELSAWELNASAAGRIGQPVLALVPWRDDVLVIGCDHSLYALQGDPAASSGQVITLSESIGILQHAATCIAPDGTIYFVGTGGFFRMAAVGEPQNLSKGREDNFFANINRKTHYCELEYDRDRHQVWIFVTQMAGGASTHMVYDVRTDSFWPQQLPAAHGPLCALVYDGDGPTDRFLLLGGRDGYVRRLDPAVNSDDGAAISSQCLIGPVQPEGDFGEFVINEWMAVTGGGTTNLVVQVLVGESAETAAAAAPTTLATYATAGRQPRNFTRFRANTYFVKLSNSMLDKTWSFESLQAIGFAGGIVR